MMLSIVFTFAICSLLNDDGRSCLFANISNDAPASLYEEYDLKI